MTRWNKGERMGGKNRNGSMRLIPAEAFAERDLEG